MFEANVIGTTHSNYHTFYLILVIDRCIHAILRKLEYLYVGGLRLWYNKNNKDHISHKENSVTAIRS